MLFYVIILGFGALAGIIINILINHQNIVYTVIGSIVILLTGSFACFVLYYPYYFDSFRSLITTLVIAAIFFIVIYVGLRLIVNTVLLRDEPLIQSETDTKRNVSSQSVRIRSSYIGRHGHANAKTIGTVAVTRLNKAKLQSVRQANVPASIASPDHVAHSSEDVTRPLPSSKETFTSDLIADDMRPVLQFNVMKPIDEDADSIPQELPELPLETIVAVADDADSIPQELPELPLETIVAAADDDTTIQQELPELPLEAIVAAVDDADSIPQELPEQPLETIVAAADDDITIQPTSVINSNSILLDKAIELIGAGKYLFATQLLKACLSNPSSFIQQKQADILMMECLVLSEQYDQAQKKWLEVLNKMYILEPSDKLKLKHILSLLNNRSKQVS